MGEMPSDRVSILETVQAKVKRHLTGSEASQARVYRHLRRFETFASE
jgi:hypothetical protein